MDPILTKIRKDIANGKIEKPLKNFIIHCKNQSLNKKYKKIVFELTSIQSQYNRVDRNYIKNLITYEQKSISETKIINAFLKILNEYYVIEDEGKQIQNVRTIIAFSLLASACLVITLLFGEYFYTPRQQNGVPFFLLYTYSTIYFCSLAIVLLYVYFNFGLSLRLIFTFMIILLSSFLFLNAPYISTLYIQHKSKQESANDRYKSGLWKNAMYIYIKEKYTLNKQSAANILEMKTTLNKAGYYIYEINEYPDYRVIETLLELQKKFNLNPDGIVGRSTQNVLYGLIYSKELDVDLRSVTSQELVRKIQSFQNENNLTNDGVIGSETLNELKRIHEANIESLNE